MNGGMRSHSPPIPKEEPVDLDNLTKNNKNSKKHDVT